MCKNRRLQTVAIEEAKHECERVFAVFESGEDLKHIVRVYNGVLAIMYDVDRYGECEVSEHKACKDPSPFGIKQLFGFNDWGIRNMYRVVAC